MPALRSGQRPHVCANLMRARCPLSAEAGIEIQKSQNRKLKGWPATWIHLGATAGRDVRFARPRIPGAGIPRKNERSFHFELKYHRQYVCDSALPAPVRPPRLRLRRGMSPAEGGPPLSLSLPPFPISCPSFRVSSSEFRHRPPSSAVSLPITNNN